MATGPQEIVERPVQLRGSAWARRALKLAGWQLDFDGLPARQGVLAIYPHTSNWDFVLGIVTKWAIGIPVTFWGKDSLFRVRIASSSAGSAGISRSARRGASSPSRA